MRPANETPASNSLRAELMRGEPLWPGKTDLDQLCMIRSSLGELTAAQTRTLLSQNVYSPANLERLANLSTSASLALEARLPARVGPAGLDFVASCLRMDPARRPASDQLLHHAYIQSARMAQFVREASAAPGSAGTQQSSARSRGTLDASAGAAWAPSRRSNSQSLMLLASSQQASRSQAIGGGVTDQSTSTAHRAPPGAGADAAPSRHKRKQLASGKATAASRLDAPRKRPEPLQAVEQQTQLQVGAGAGAYERLARKLAPLGRQESAAKLIGASRSSSVSQLPALVADERGAGQVTVCRPRAGRQANSRTVTLATNTQVPNDRQQRRWL